MHTVAASILLAAESIPLLKNWHALKVLYNSGIGFLVFIA